MPNLNAEPAGFFVSSSVALHKTHVEKPGFNICDPTPAVSAKIFDMNCSLVCTLGELFVDGGIMFSRLRIHPDECDGEDRGTRWISQLHMVSIGCPSDYDEESPANNNTWVGSNVVVHGQGKDFDNKFPTPEIPRMPYDWGPDFSVPIKTDVTMTAIAPGHVGLTITTLRLMPDTNTYFTCGSVTMSCFETDWSVANKGNGGRTYASEITEASYDAEKCGGDLRYMHAQVSLRAYDFGCSTINDEFGEKCNLKSGAKTYSCLVCLVTPKTPLAWNPYVVQLGVNSQSCLQYGIGCGCFKYQDQKIFPAPQYQSFDPLFFVDAGCPDEIPHTNKQRIQYGYSSEWPSGKQIHIMLKTVENGALCVAAKTVDEYNVESPWIIGSLSSVQSFSPFIMKADFSGLIAGDPVFQFYGMEFPTALIQECIDTVEQPAGPPPLEPHGRTLTLEPAPTKQFSDRPEVIAAKAMAKKMQSVRASPCINLGMALETAPSCGCGGGILHQCSVHGECRQAGNDLKKKLCWKCDDYQPGKRESK